MKTDPKSIPLDRYKLLQILDAMGDAVVVFDTDGVVLLCNPAFEKLLGLPPDVILARKLNVLFQGIAPELHDIMITLLDTRETFSQEFAIYNDHQKRVYRLDTIPIEEEGEISEGVAVFHDITQERQTEKMRRDFVANVSHELRTPLSAITGYAETLLDGALEDQNVSKEFVQIIFNHSQRLTQLVRDLLDLSKLESEECPFELTPTNLQAIVEKVVELSQKGLSEKNISFFYEPPTALPQVMAHESNIEQVVTNLIDNAIKYTPTGGTIHLRVAQQGQFVQVDVEDTGIGIEAKHIPRLFERFYRVDKARSRDLGGTGLGLSIVKHIVQYHGGDVFVKSKPGEGSIFSFTLCLPQDAEGKPVLTGVNHLEAGLGSDLLQE